MATLKEHQSAMVDLLANGSGIPASASRLAHAMHDLINVLYVAFPNLPQTKDEDWINGRETRVTITPGVTLDIKDIIRAVEANSPGLNDKAFSKREKALKTDSPAKWPTPAEQRVKELENTIRQLKANNSKLRAEKEFLVADCAKVRADYQMLQDKYLRRSEAEQAGCRKEDTQVCEPEWMSWSGGECPLPADTIVEVKFYDRQTESGSKASAYVWRHGALGVRELDIIAYRVIPK